MRETRRLDIKNKVFSKEDMKRLAQIMLKEYKSSKTSGHRKLVFQVKCSDGTSYETEALEELFSDGEVMDLKHVTVLDFDFLDYTRERRINFSVSHGGELTDRLTVAGNDRNWVNGTYDHCIDIISAAPNQDAWIKRHPVITFNLLSLGCGTILLSIMSFLFEQFPIPIKPPKWAVAMHGFFESYLWAEYIFFYFMRWLDGLFPAVIVRDWLLHLWPSIEFDFGPEHKKKEKRQRQFIMAVATLIVLPIAISFITDIVRAI